MRGLTQLLRSEFPEEAISRSNSVYFRTQDATRVVEFLRTRRLAITGVEGFRLEGNTLAPDLELIAHLSPPAPGVDWDEYVDDCADKTQQVLAIWPREPQLVVNFGAVATGEAGGRGAGASGRSADA